MWVLGISSLNREMTKYVQAMLGLWGCRGVGGLGLSDLQGNEVLELNPSSSFLRGNGGLKMSAFA